MQTHLTVRGLVIRETSYHDADKLIDLLTDTGIRTVQVRSARKAGSKYAAVTQLFCYGEYCLRCSGERFYLDSAVSINAFYGIRDDIEALALASYFSELVRKTRTNEPQPQILQLCLYALRHLSEHDRPARLVKAVFELRLTAELGQMPNLVCCPVCLRYQLPHPVLRISAAEVICMECRREKAAGDLETTPAVLAAARHVIYADMERIFQFRLKGQSAEDFYLYAENYLLVRLEMFFPTLKFYRDLIGDGTEEPLVFS